MTREPSSFTILGEGASRANERALADHPGTVTPSPVPTPGPRSPRWLGRARRWLPARATGTPSVVVAAAEGEIAPIAGRSWDSSTATDPHPRRP